MQKIIIKKKSENIDRHRNVTFSCLEAIAIIMVIDDHTGRHIDHCLFLYQDIFIKKQFMLKT